MSFAMDIFLGALGGEYSSRKRKRGEGKNENGDQRTAGS
jgi:hypothetical protein